MSGEKKHNIDKHEKDGTSSEESDSQSEPEQNVDSGDEASTETPQTDSGKEPTADMADTSTETLQTESEKERTADNVDTSAKTSQWCFPCYKVYIYWICSLNLYYKQFLNNFRVI